MNYSFLGCAQTDNPVSSEISTKLMTGAERTTEYLHLLKGKKVGLLINQTSTIEDTHIVDSLISLGIDVKKIFAPEHGYRGEKSDGELIEDGLDKKTGVPVISLYGSNKKPTDQDLHDLDMVIYDIQDVGARFYTYISAMHYMMESAARNKVSMLILDRPNPNGDYVDGPVWNLDKPSYVGMHPIPIVYGMTAGELAQMILGEGWVEGPLDLQIIKCGGWDHRDRYSLKIKPSPNLPNDQAIALYPSLCLFEGTVISIGRGTYHPFQVIGYPGFQPNGFSFTPRSIPGMSKYPKFENELCSGIDLRNTDVRRKLDLSYLLNFYKSYPDKENFFKKYFLNLSGSNDLKNQIIKGWSEDEIRSSWQEDLTIFKSKRKKYLLYEDFE